MEGLGHTITALSTYSNTQDVGLVGIMETSGTIRDIGLLDADIEGTSYVGGLVGYNSGTVVNAYIRGGLTSGTFLVGGLVGDNASTVVNAYATDIVRGTGSAPALVGGLVGRNGGTVANAYASGPTNGDSGIGGLLGSNGGTIKNVYASGTVHGTTGVGGLVGINSGTVKFAYATGATNGTSNVGGLVGLSSSAGSIINGYYDSGSTGRAHGTRGDGSIGLTTQEWLTQGPIATGVFDTQTTWVAGYAYPVLKTLPYVLVTADGSEVYGSSTPTVTVSSVVDETGADGTSLYGGNTNWISNAADNVGTGYALGGLGGTVSAGYQLTYTGSVTVTPRPLVITPDAVSRVYGDSNPATGTATGDNLVNGDSISSVELNSTADQTSPVGSYVLSASDARFGSGSALNYSISYTTLSNGLTVTKRPLTVTGTRPYDGNTDADASILSLNGTIGGDDISLASTGSGTLASKDVLLSGGVPQPVGLASLGSLTLAGAQDGNYKLTTFGSAVTITPAPLTVTGTRLYDGNTDANASILALNGIIGSDSVSLGASESGMLASKDVLLSGGVPQPVALASLGSLTLVGSQANDYALRATNSAVTIVPKSLIVSAVTDRKVYNGTTTSTGVPVVVSGLVGGDSADGFTQAFTSKDVLGADGSLIAVTPGSGTINDGNGGNDYTLSTNTATGTITPAPLVASLTGKVEKYYDGNTNATLSASNYALSGVFGSDKVTLNDPTAGSYDTPDVGTGKTVTAAGLGLLGADSGDYVLSGTSVAGTVGIIDPLSSKPGNHYSGSQYQNGGGTPSGSTTPVSINFQQSNQNTNPVTLTTFTPPANQNIAPGSGPDSLYPPISQFDKSQYSNDTLPDFAPQAGEATVLTMIARAEENSRQSPKIDALWQAGAADWPANDNVLKNVRFTDGNDQSRTPDGNNGFAFTEGTTDIAALLQHGPVMLDGTKSAGQAAPTPWLLAIKMTADGKGIIANDPLTGDQVVLAYDPATKTVGGVTAVIDPKTHKAVPLGAGATTLAGQKTQVPDAVWPELKAFKPATYFAVSI